MFVLSFVSFAAGAARELASSLFGVGFFTSLFTVIEGCLEVGLALFVIYSLFKRGLGIVAWFLWARSMFVVARDYVIQCSKELPEDRAVDVRTLFDKQGINFLQPFEGHTHGGVASLRASALAFAKTFASVLKREIYAYQASAAMQNAGIEGSHRFMSVKDLDADACFSTRKNAFTLGLMVDVDQWLDVEEILATDFAPMLIATFVPSCAGKGVGEYVYSFLSDQKVDFKVAGGGHYTHPVWCYGHDTLVVTKRVLGIPLVFAEYKVNRKYLGPDHELILLTPQVKWKFPWGLIAAVLDSGEKRLRYLEPVRGDDVLLEVHRKEGLFYSIGKTGHFTSLELPAQKFSSAELRAGSIEGKLIAGTFTTQTGGDLDKAILLADFLKGRVTRKTARVYPLEKAVLEYQLKPTVIEDSARAKVQAFMSPIIAGLATAPTECLSNEQACIEGRIEKVRSPVLPMTNAMNERINEFVEFLVPDAYSGMAAPCSMEEVRDHLSRSPQVQSFLKGLVSNKAEEPQCFMKAEPNSKFGDPRNITMYNPALKNNYAQFIYVLSEYIATTCPWYAFGRTPASIAQRVAEICNASASVTKTDFSRFDGHICNLLRAFEDRLLIRFFNAAYATEVRGLHEAHFNVRVHGRFGTSFQLGYAQGSGAMDTAVFNSMRNGFIFYLALRTSENPATMTLFTPTEAWTHLVAKFIAGGDDGLVGDISPAQITRAAKSLGQDIKAEPVARGEHGVSFLSRRYGPGVFLGDVNSCSEFLRLSGNFHTTAAVAGSYTPAQKLKEKAYSIFLSNPNTPVIGPFVTHVVHLIRKEDPKWVYEDVFRVWNSTLDQAAQYPNFRDAWMEDYVAGELGGDDFSWWEKEVRKLATLEACLSPLVLKEFEVKPTVPMIVNKELVVPEGCPVPIPANRTEPLPLVPSNGDIVVGDAKTYLDSRKAHVKVRIQVLDKIVERSVPASSRTGKPLQPIPLSEGEKALSYMRQVFEKDEKTGRRRPVPNEFKEVSFEAEARWEAAQKKKKEKAGKHATPSASATETSETSSAAEEIKSPQPRVAFKASALEDKIAKEAKFDASVASIKKIFDAANAAKKIAPEALPSLPTAPEPPAWVDMPPLPPLPVEGAALQEKVVPKNQKKANSKSRGTKPSRAVSNTNCDQHAMSRERAWVPSKVNPGPMPGLYSAKCPGDVFEDELFEAEVWRRWQGYLYDNPYHHNLRIGAWKRFPLGHPLHSWAQLQIRQLLKLGAKDEEHVPGTIYNPFSLWKYPHQEETLIQFGKAGPIDATCTEDSSVEIEPHTIPVDRVSDELRWLENAQFCAELSLVSQLHEALVFPGPNTPDVPMPVDGLQFLLEEGEVPEKPWPVVPRKRTASGRDDFDGRHAKRARCD